MTKDKLPVRLRPVIEDDVNLIFSSWLRSYKPNNANRNLTSTIYFTEHHKVIEKILKSGSTIVAVNDHDPNQIFGFVNFERVEGVLCVHYLYVKHSFRNFGIGKTLLASAGYEKDSASIFTHSTRMSERLAAKYNFIYHPYIIINWDDYHKTETLQEASNDSEEK